MNLDDSSGVFRVDGAAITIMQSSRALCYRLFRNIVNDASHAIDSFDDFECQTK